MNEIAPPDHYEDMHRVVERYLKGEGVKSIAEQTGIKRGRVMELLAEYKDLAAHDDQIVDRAREAVVSMDKHYSLLISKFWAVHDDAGDNLTAKNNALKNIADVEAKRLDALQKAGLLDNASLGTQIADMEEKAEAIKQLLKDVVAEYPQTREMILSGLNNIFNTSEGIVVVRE